MWEKLGPFGLFLIFIVSLLWVYVAARLWYRGQLNTYKGEADHRNQLEEESKDGK